MVELAVAMVIISVISTIALSNFIRFRNRASYASCSSNQRHVLEAAVLYISMSSPGTATFDVDTLTGGGYLAVDVAECPKSSAHAMNDYTITVVDNGVTQIDCKIEPAEHHWAIP